MMEIGAISDGVGGLVGLILTLNWNSAFGLKKGTGAAPDSTGRLIADSTPRHNLSRPQKTLISQIVIG